MSEELHNFLTPRCVACTDPAADMVTLSHLDLPVIFKFDSDDKLSQLLNKETPPGYGTNINKVTAKFDLFCSVPPYASNFDQFEKRLSLVNYLHPDTEPFCDGVAKGEWDHFDGSSFHSAYNKSRSASRYGYTVYISKPIHLFFTELRPEIEKNNANLFSHQKAAPTMEERFYHKKSINYQIIEQMAYRLFENQNFDRSDLKGAYNLAAEVSLTEIQSIYRREGLTSQEFVACGRVRTVINYRHYNLDTLNES